MITPKCVLTFCSSFVIPLMLLRTLHLGDNENALLSLQACVVVDSVLQNNCFVVIFVKDQWKKYNSSLSQPRTGISPTVTPVESLKR